jgi:hypothetical protein
MPPTWIPAVSFADALAAACCSVLVLEVGIPLGDLAA